MMQVPENRDTDFYFIKSKRNKEVLVHGGREFHKIRVNNSKSTVWRCAKAPSCCATIKTLDNVIIHTSEHKYNSCQPNFAKMVMKKSFQSLKEKVKSSEGRPIPQMYKEEIVALKEQGLDLVEPIPTFTSVCTALYRSRNSSQNVRRTIFRNESEVEIPKDYIKFLLFDHQSEENRIIAFATEQARQRMADMSLFLGDGTFKCCIKPFMQLYVLHADMGSTDDTTKITPLVYCLLMNKTKSTYITLFRLIKEFIPFWNPKEFHTDFEEAVIEATKVVFPESTNKACFFHFCQSLQKKGKKLNLTKKLHTKRHIRLLMALPLIPEELVDEGFLYIMEDSPADEDTVKFNDYFVETYMDGGKFPPLLWSVYRRRHRTTNALEAWHATLNRFVEKKKMLNFLQFLNIIHRDAKMQDLRFSTPEETSLSRPRKKQAMEKDHLISITLNDLSSGKITVGHCLEKLASLSH